METKIAVLEAKVEHMMVHTKELTLRVRANEKVVASVSLLGVIACTFIGAGYFAPKADAMTPGEMIQKMRDWESEQNRTPIEESINSSLLEYEKEPDGSDETTKQEVLLQLPSDGDQPSAGRRYDRCHHRSWIRFIQKRTGKNCWSGHPIEENEKPRREGPWYRRN